MSDVKTLIGSAGGLVSGSVVMTEVVRNLLLFVLCFGQGLNAGLG